MARFRFPSQPLKLIHLFVLFLTIPFIRLPWWLVYYSWRPNRPRKSWTLRRTIIVRAARRVFQLTFRFGVREDCDPSLDVPQEELEPFNARFVWIPKLDEDIVGVVAEHAARTGAESIALPAYWILKKGTGWSPAYENAQEGEKVMLYFHGGAFVLGTAHPSHMTAGLPKESLNYSTSLSRVLSVEYRLSSGPPHFERKDPFPSAVIDGITAYKYLVCEMGFLPQNITVAGDSSGGNIALAVTRYIVESRLPRLQPPGGLIAACPVTDLSFSRVGPNTSHHLNLETDKLYVPPNADPSFVAEWLFGEYMGEIDHEEAKHNRYLSPSSKFAKPLDVDGETKLFSGFPRSYVMGGGAEYMFDDIVALAERMKDDGVDVTTDFPPDAVHGYYLRGWHEPERTASLIKCAAWLDSRLTMKDVKA